MESQLEEPTAPTIPDTTSAPSTMVEALSALGIDDHQHEGHPQGDEIRRQVGIVLSRPQLMQAGRVLLLRPEHGPRPAPPGPLRWLAEPPRRHRRDSGLAQDAQVQAEAQGE